MLNQRNFINKYFLNFNRYNLHAIGKEITADIEHAKQLLNEAPKPLSLQDKDLCRLVGIYYALYKRSEPDAKPYLEQYLQLAENNSYEQAEAYGFLAYIQIIQGGYHDSRENTPLNIALNILKNLDQDNLENISLRIFLEKYLPLMRYRDSYLNLSKEDKRSYIKEDMDAAIEGIKNIITNAEQYSGTDIDIDAAEANHLLAVMRIKQNDLADAKKNLEMALQLEQDFSKRIAIQLNHKEEEIVFHWMTYTTGQSLADLYRRENNYDTSITLLHQVLKGQNEFFHPLKNHPDIAKTLDFLANSYRDKGDFQHAFDYYLQTIEMKEKVLAKHSPLIKVTLDSLHELMKKYPELYNHADKRSLENILKKLQVSDVAQEMVAKQQDYFSWEIVINYCLHNKHDFSSLALTSSFIFSVCKNVFTGFINKNPTVEMQKMGSFLRLFNVKNPVKVNEKEKIIIEENNIRSKQEDSGEYKSQFRK